MADVEIVEVGPRDGLQSIGAVIDTDAKVTLVNALSGCGFRRIECASFVSPRWVPHMADSGAVMERIERATGVTYAALVPNVRGLERAVAARAGEVAIFVSASEGFSRANLNATIDESFDRLAPVAEGAVEAGIPLRGYVSCVTDCPVDGSVPPAAVAGVTRRLFEMGCHEVSLGETLGRGAEASVREMLKAVAEVAAPERLAGHFHDTAGVALTNVGAALDAGLRVFDASAGGLGGCPYAPGASGNVGTEVLMDFLEGLGMTTGLDRDRLGRAAEMARGLA